jgi:mono/diheme cytochrome c family protein
MNLRFKWVTFLIALLLSVGYVLSMTRAASSSQGKKSGRKGAGKIESAYLLHCARCHGADGRGETTLGKLYSIPNLTEAALHSRFSDKELSAIINSGQGRMPGFKKYLSKAEITALVAYVRRFRK